MQRKWVSPSLILHMDNYWVLSVSNIIDWSSITSLKCFKINSTALTSKSFICLIHIEVVLTHLILFYLPWRSPIIIYKWGVCEHNHGILSCGFKDTPFIRFSFCSHQCKWSCKQDWTGITVSQCGETGCPNSMRLHQKWRIKKSGIQKMKKNTKVIFLPSVFFFFL